MTNLSTFLPIFFSTLALCIAVVIAWYFFTHHRILRTPADRIGDTEKSQGAAKGQGGDAGPAEAEAHDVVAPPEAAASPRAPTPPPAPESGPAASSAAVGGEETIEVVEEAPRA